MKPRTLAVWIAVGAALLTVYFLGGRRPAEKSPSDIQWLAISKDSVRSITIREGLDATVQLNMEGGRWVRSTDTGGLPVDTGAVESFLEMASSLRAIEVVSDSPAKAALFGLDEATATRIAIEDTSLSTVFHAGKPGPDGDATYMRRGAEPEIWSVRGFDLWRLKRLSK